jgi:uncharacterized protein YidB (DUF937 family)
MKWIKWGFGAAGALLAGGALTFAVLATGGAASAEEGPGAMASRFVELLAQRLGISTEQLKAAGTEARNQLIDEMLAAGEITQAQADRMKSAEFGEGFGFHFHGGPGKGVRLAVDAVQTTATLTNLSVDAVRQELQQGKSLAQIAGEHGVSRDSLKAAIISELTASLQAKVASGEITQALADQMLARVSEHVDELIDRTGFGPTGSGEQRGFRRGMGPGAAPNSGTQ